MMKKNRDKTVLRLVKEAKPIAHWLILAAVMSILAVLCAVAAPKLLGQLVQALCDYWDGGCQGKVTDVLLPGLAVLAGVYLVSAVLEYLNMLLMNNVVSRHYSCSIRIKISDKIRKLPVKYVDQTPVGEILNRMTNDVSEVGSYIHQILDVMVKGVFQLVVITVVMFLENWVLACFVILLAPFSVWLSAKLSSECEKDYDEMFKQSGKLTQIVEESFSNYANTKAYNLEAYTGENHESINRQLEKSTAKANFRGATVYPLIKFSNALAYILINLVGGWLIVKHGVSIGVVVTIVLYARQFSSPLEQIAMGIADMKHVKSSAKRIFEIFDMEEETDASDARIPDVQGKVEFENVCFSYQEAEPLLENLNMTVEPGQSVAIVGPTGAGKTTIVNLLMRFYDIRSGTIRLDGVDIAQIPRADVRECFGMVLQDTWLFRGTIAENVAYGKPDATMDQIRDACKKTYCDHFIRTMPHGYDTIIGDDSISLSGGQKQLLTIARALLAGKPLLILDEATSNVDTRTEVLIQKAMDALMKDRTCFVIAHRLSTIVGSDMILVMDHGRIVEQGNHESLLEKRGFYYELYHSQYST